MHIAIPLYPRYTALDAVGPYTVLAFTEGFTVTFVAARPGAVLDDQGSLALTATKSYADLPYPDVIVVPGGPGTVEALQDKDLIDWITVAHERTRWTTSVCSGSFLLGAAGLLNGRRATTHWGWLEHLSGFGAQPVSERVVIDDRIITAAGVSAGIDMALTMLARMTDVATAQTVQLAMEYDPRPPFDAGSPATAPAGIAERALGLIG
ncbi:DJ-1/PfpI family protein [Amorphoplanes digitatis]|uniref:Transcriptional regulator GlxA family with amidase domain n=1 Tax=Actinoplanes digitatis TaxID=1868 RepID=A0A7W7I0G5_9ACTN|nr:DJ-1/PfpI family protein [Actinoplanes digitatis]MBB4764117.1 transcriptional regulator GlxA family with amidase domain [Actinoplanes digitatis]GID97395.1 glutamine amidotransferase [Actinoplanes digitatis]